MHMDMHIRVTFHLFISPMTDSESYFNKGTHWYKIIIGFYLNYESLSIYINENDQICSMHRKSAGSADFKILNHNLMAW